MFFHSPPRHPASPEHPPGETPLRVSRSRSRERDRRDKSDRDRDRRDDYKDDRDDRWVEYKLGYTCMCYIVSINYTLSELNAVTRVVLANFLPTKSFTI